MSLTCRYPMVRNEERRRRKLIAKWTAGLKMKKKSLDIGDAEKKSEAGLETEQSEKDEESSDIRDEETFSGSDKNDSETTVPPDTPRSKSGVMNRETPERDSKNGQRSLGDPAQNDKRNAKECEEAATDSSLSEEGCSKEHANEYPEGSGTAAKDDDLDQATENTTPARRLMSELERAPEDVRKRPPERVLVQDAAASSLATISTPTSPTLTYQRRPKFTRSPSRCQKQQASPALQNLRREHRSNKAREVAFVRSLFVVFILMLISFIPLGVILTISSSVENVPPEIFILGNLLLFFNNSINWIVYGVMNPAFRKGYGKCTRQLLTKCCGVGRERKQRSVNASLSTALSTES